MKRLLVVVSGILVIAACFAKAEGKTNSATVAIVSDKAGAAVEIKLPKLEPVKKPVAESKAESVEPEKTPEEKAKEDRLMTREDRRSKRTPAVEKFVSREGWQSGVGYRAMEKYVTRLSYLCRERMPGMVVGIAGGKKGILLSVTFKAKRNFFLAQENTKDFLTAIVEDLEKLPEPVSAQVFVSQEGKQIISAMRPRKGKDVKVKYLL
jgi:hypothetical protein